MKGKQEKCDSCRKKYSQININLKKKKRINSLAMQLLSESLVSLLAFLLSGYQWVGGRVCIVL